MTQDIKEKIAHKIYSMVRDIEGYDDVWLSILPDRVKESYLRIAEEITKEFIERETKLIEALEYYASSYCTSKEPNAKVHCKYTDIVATETLKDLGIL